MMRASQANKDPSQSVLMELNGGGPQATAAFPSVRPQRKGFLGAVRLNLLFELFPPPERYAVFPEQVSSG